MAVFEHDMRDDDSRTSGMARPTFEPTSAGPRPDWLKVRLNANDRYVKLKRLVAGEGLHTVCQSAACPNIGECWSRGAVTFMILGNVCTRSCGFCDVATGRPGRVDWSEPERLAQSLARLHLRYAVITSVDRDDLDDGGAAIWAETIRQVKRHCPEMRVEVLTPDFKGQLNDVATVIEAGPDVFAHNLETVERLHGLVRPQASYERSLRVLAHAESLRARVKSGVMVGLGETDDEVFAALRDLRRAGCDIVSVGQYMRPSRRHLPVRRWVPPETFQAYETFARELGFTGVKSGPLVRSSYRADEQAGAVPEPNQPLTPLDALAEQGAPTQHDDQR
jgi:lipoic acid synthetase